MDFGGDTSGGASTLSWEDELMSTEALRSRIKDLSKGERKDIKQVFLGGNSLSKVPKSLFTKLPAMRQLVLRGNDISSLPLAVKDHPKLRVLNLTKCKFPKKLNKSVVGKKKVAKLIAALEAAGCLEEE